MPPKTKTNSLNARVAIAAAIQIAGYYEVWDRIFNKCGMTLDENLIRVLKRMYRIKLLYNTRSATKEGKLKRNKTRCNKMTKLQNQQMQDAKKGCTYSTGIAMTEAMKHLKRIQKSDKRNPKDLPASQRKCCYYHPDYCTKLGHVSCNNRDCFMFGKSEDVRNRAKTQIHQENLKKILDDKKIIVCA